MSRICAVYPASDPASKLKATTFREAFPLRTTCAVPVNGVRVAGTGVRVGEGVGEGAGDAVGAGQGWGDAVGVADGPGVAVTVGEADGCGVQGAVGEVDGVTPSSPPPQAETSSRTQMSTERPTLSTTFIQPSQRLA